MTQLAKYWRRIYSKRKWKRVSGHVDFVFQYPLELVEAGVQNLHNHGHGNHGCVDAAFHHSDGIYRLFYRHHAIVYLAVLFSFEIERQFVAMESCDFPTASLFLSASYTGS